MAHLIKRSMEMARNPISRWLRAPILLLAIAAWLGSPATSAQRLSGMDLAHALQQGGYILVTRNARSPEESPERQAPGNLHGERELDQYGQGQMSVIGYAFRELEIPVDQTLTSPAYRSRQSGNYLGFGEQHAVDTLAENARESWLAQRVAAAQPAGENTVIVTHGSLIAKSFGRDARNISNAETLIYRPREGGADLVARLTVEDWAKLAVN
jgi:phosphohistidine phosphatase SixA